MASGFFAGIEEIFVKRGSLSGRTLFPTALLATPSVGETSYDLRQDLLAQPPTAGKTLLSGLSTPRTISAEACATSDMFDTRVSPQSAA